MACDPWCYDVEALSEVPEADLIATCLTAPLATDSELVTDPVHLTVAAHHLGLLLSVQSHDALSLAHCQVSVASGFSLVF